MQEMVAQLEFDFAFGCPSIEAHYYREGAQDLIRKLVPAELLAASSHNLSVKRACFADLLPLVRWSDLNKAPCSLSVLLLCKYRLNATAFFCDMISRWLLPQRPVNVELFFSSDVRLPHLCEDVLSVAEVVIYLKSAQEVEEVRRNLQAIETEIKLGVVSTYHARRILEFKGLSTDGKNAMIQEKISSLIQSHSKDFDQGIFSQMQQFLVNCPEAFKENRDYHHLSRIISNLYSVRKVIKQNVAVVPAKRHVMVKFFKTQLKFSQGNKQEKPVLGILAGLNLLQEQELFEADHLSAAVRQLLPTAQFVIGSAILDPMREALLQTVYLEIEKRDGTEFNLLEIQRLRQGLTERLKNHIEQRTHPIYMPRNEEEVLRHMMTLSQQIRFVNDQAHGILSFDETRNGELHFTVIVARVHQEGAPSIQELFAREKVALLYIPDRVRIMGTLGRKYVRKYVKEVTVFRTAIPARKFLREDRSVDLYRARQDLFEKVVSALGPVRDYNGGMILKQHEQLEALKSSLGKVGQSHLFLIEKFFHALMPLEMRTSCEVDALKQLFLLLIAATKSDGRLPFFGNDFLFKQEAQRVLAVLPGLSDVAQKNLQTRVDALQIPVHQSAHLTMEINGKSYVGRLLLHAEPALQEQFLQALANR